jgi:hypothetical protein
MDADDWLKTIEKKLQVVQCNNREKVQFASHPLEGPAADWKVTLQIGGMLDRGPGSMPQVGERGGRCRKVAKSHLSALTVVWRSDGIDPS